MEPFSIFKSISLVLQVLQRCQKQSSEAETQDPGRHTGRVEDHKALGPCQHPSYCGRQACQRWYCNTTCRSRGERIMCYSSCWSESCLLSTLDSQEPARTPEFAGGGVIPLQNRQTDKSQIQEDFLQNILGIFLLGYPEKDIILYLGYFSRISLMDKYWIPGISENK